MASQQPGPFDRILKTSDAAAPPERDRAAVYVIGTIAGLAILLLVLVLPPVSILSRGDGGPGIPARPGDADTYTSAVRSGIPRLPAGLVAASALFDLAAPPDQRGQSRITVPLKQKETEERSLALYTYVDGRWERLSDAALVAGGAAVRGEVSALPGNVVVLRRSKSTLQVAGAVPAGTTVDERAAAVLTALHPLVFIPAENGDLAGSPPAVPPASYKVVPGIVAPSAEVVDNILRSGETRSRHAAAIADAVKQGNFAGINVDYRAVSGSLKEQFTAFAEELATALHEDGRSLTLTLPAPANEGGAMETGAYDWEKLGELADTIELAGELDQELYFQRMEAALEYVTGKVDPNKVLLTISSLSVERGGDGLRSMALMDALTLASVVATKQEGDIVPSTQVQLVSQNLAESEGASGMHWDDTARAVTFSYPGRGGKRTVWIANQFSAAFRLQLARKYQLAGVAVTDASIDGGGGDVWTSIRELADTGTLELVKPNGELFVPSWTATGGQLSGGSGTAVTWVAPQPGSYDVTVVVSDGAARAGQRVTLEVVEPPAP